MLLPQQAFRLRSLKRKGNMIQPANASDTNATIPSALLEHRLQHGQCPTCGQQLYGFEIDSACCLAALFTRNEKELRKNPLTIPDLVDQGKCLKCEAPSTSDTSETKPPEHPLSSLKSQIKSDKGDTKKLPSPKPSKETPPFERASVAGAAYVPREGSGLMIPVNSSSSSSSSSSASSSLAIYHGEYNAKGERHGHGTITWANGDVYKGSFVRNQRHGHGVLTFASNDCDKPDNGEYVGDWRDNQMHGEGTRRYPNGDVYVGHYFKGKRHGHGKFYYSNGDTYSGPWDNNQMQGTGSYYYSSGQRFEGMFITSKRNGKGKLERNDGTVDYFQYVNDERVGHGVRWNGDHTRAWRLQVLSSGGVQAEPISIPEATTLLQELEHKCNQRVEEIMLAQLLE